MGCNMPLNRELQCPFFLMILLKEVKAENHISHDQFFYKTMWVSGLSQVSAKLFITSSNLVIASVDVFKLPFS